MANIHRLDLAIDATLAMWFGMEEQLERPAQLDVGTAEDTADSSFKVALCVDASPFPIPQQTRLLPEYHAAISVAPADARRLAAALVETADKIEGGTIANVHRLDLAIDATLVAFDETLHVRAQLDVGTVEDTVDSSFKVALCVYADPYPQAISVVPADARRLAAALVETADKIEGGR
jgi:hypothetical protein